MLWSVLTESRIPLKSVLGGMRIFALSILMNRLNETESAVFLYCRFSLFLKDPFFLIILTIDHIHASILFIMLFNWEYHSSKTVLEQTIIVCQGPFTGPNFALENMDY